MLDGVERICVDADHLRVREERVRARREVLQTRADSEHAIGVVCDLVCAGRSRYAERAEIQGNRAVGPRRVQGGLREEVRRRSTDAGFDLHLLKPFRPDVLHSLLERVEQSAW